MLLPPQFQTPAPAALGAKVVAMPAPPKPPHVHQWVAVPDSKIHSRCAECGTVTLTEIVAPKASTFAGAKMVSDPFVGLRTTLATEIGNSALTAIVRDFLDGSAERTRAISHARAVLDEMGFKKTIDLPQHRRAEFLKALTAPPAPDPGGWLPNPGRQPVADDVLVQVKTELCSVTVDVPAHTVNWGFAPITHWRLAK